MTELLLYDEINAENWARYGFGVSARMLSDALKELSGESVKLRINSPGGDTQEGWAMFQAVKTHGDVLAVGEGLVASAATLPFLAAKERQVSKGTRFMIHESRVSVFDAIKSEMEMLAQALEGFNDDAAEEYARVGKGSRDDYAKAMDPGTYYTAKQTVEEGFASKIVEGGDDVKARASQKDHPWLAGADSDFWNNAEFDRPWIGSQSGALKVMKGRFGTPGTVAFRACFESGLAATPLGDRVRNIVREPDPTLTDEEVDLYKSMLSLIDL